jgi:hypothetical protein
MGIAAAHNSAVIGGGTAAVIAFVVLVFVASGVHLAIASSQQAPQQVAAAAAGNQPHPDPVHASDTSAAILARLVGQLPRRAAVTGAVVSSLNAALAVAANNGTRKREARS